MIFRVRAAATNDASRRAFAYFRFRRLPFAVFFFALLCSDSIDMPMRAADAHRRPYNDARRARRAFRHAAAMPLQWRSTRVEPRRLIFLFALLI